MPTMKPRELLRADEAACRRPGLGPSGFRNGDIIAVVPGHRVLTERSFVVAGRRADVGWRPEPVLERF
jgi:hypothetical protein